MNCNALFVSGATKPEEAVILSRVLERFQKKSAITVMAQLGLARALDAKWIDKLFAEHSTSQYTRELLFSTMVDLMSLVSLGLSPSVHAAAKSMGEQLNVAVQSVYNKLNGIEPQVVRALVSGSAERLVPVVQELEFKRAPTVKGFRLRIVDGNHLAASEKRLKVLRKFRGAVLPGQSLVVYDPDLGLVLDVLPCEDAHTQERLLMQSSLTQAKHELLPPIETLHSEAAAFHFRRREQAHTRPTRLAETAAPFLRPSTAWLFCSLPRPIRPRRDARGTFRLRQPPNPR